MSNEVNNNPITIDTTGTITAKRVNVASVTIVASTDAPTVVLSDTDGNEIFRYVPAVMTLRTRTLAIGPTSWNGIVADTLTNIIRVFINQESTS